MITNSSALFSVVRTKEFDEQELQAMHGISKRSIALSILLMVAGALACIYFYVSTIVATYFIGLLLLIGACFFGANAFLVRRLKVAIVDALVCVLYLLASLLAFRRPVEAAAVLTLTFSFIFMFEGFMRIFVGVAFANRTYPWIFLNGVTTLLLGILLFWLWPSSSLWMMGTLIGVDMVLAGSALLFASIEIYRQSQPIDAIRTAKAVLI